VRNATHYAIKVVYKHCHYSSTDVATARSRFNPKIYPKARGDDFVERKEEQAQLSSFKKEAPLSDLFWRYRFGDNEELAELMRPVDEAR
jgi:hypothetical protein